MREFGLAIEIRRIAQATVRARGGGRVDDVRVRIGNRHAIDPDRLMQAWAAIVLRTPEEHAHLTIDWDRGRQRCLLCRHECARDEREPSATCAICAGPLAYEQGTALDVVEVKYEPGGGRVEESSRGEAS